MGFYFDRIYNPVYDILVAQNAPYHQLQKTCIKELEPADGDQLLCSGEDTSEILPVLIISGVQKVDAQRWLMDIRYLATKSF